MLASDFDYHLPPELIAQTPVHPRDAARLLQLQRASGTLSHHVFFDLPDLLRAGDLLVFNDTRVLRARLRGHKIGENGEVGGRVEALLLREHKPDVWEVLLKPSARLRPQTPLLFVSGDGSTQVRATPLQRTEEGWLLQFLVPEGHLGRELLHRLGEVPLPPYITARTSTEDDYQTIYARQDAASSTRYGEEAPNAKPHALESAAAPTAGLHFTPELLNRLQERGVESCAVTLGIGIGTFRPMKTENLEDHVMHREAYEISPHTAARIAQQKRRGGRIVAVGTTTVRVLESAARAAKNGAASDVSTSSEEDGAIVRSGWAQTDIFIRPGHQFQVVDALITNFHLPRSTLLVMIAAFAQATSTPQEKPENSSAGLSLIRAAYEEAVRQDYRFFSFGDAMLLD
jgi:S-adenosylmethionine:tRNA ribosyltransferase-isomerase